MPTDASCTQRTALHPGGAGVCNSVCPFGAGSANSTPAPCGSSVNGPGARSRTVTPARCASTALTLGSNWLATISSRCDALICGSAQAARRVEAAVASRSATAARTSGISSRPYCSASWMGSKPRIRKVVTPSSQYLSSASRTCSGVPTKPVELPDALVSAAMPVHSRSSTTLPCAAVASSRCAHAGDGLADLRQRFTPQRVDVGVLAGDFDGDVGRAAEVDRQVAVAHRPHAGVLALDVILRAVVVERPRRAPGLFHDVEIFVGALVALVVVEVIAVALLLGVVAAADDVDRHAAVAELVEGGELACRQGRRHEAGTMRQQDAQFIRLRGDVGGDLEAVHRAAAVRHQHAVEAGVFVRPRHRAEVALVDHGALRQQGLRHFLGGAVADEFYAHDASFAVMDEMPATPAGGVDVFFSSATNAARPLLIKIVSFCGVWMRLHSTSR